MFVFDCFMVYCIIDGIADLQTISSRKGLMKKSAGRDYSPHKVCELPYMYVNKRVMVFVLDIVSCKA